MELKDGVLRLLGERNGVFVHKEWLDACVEWILEEEGASGRLSEQRLYELVYEQWLHADLSEVTPHPSLPPLAADKGLVSGSFVVQVTSVVDVGCAAYGQLQKMKGQDIDSTDGADKKTFDPKPTRLLHLTLTDGMSEVMAMEYMPIPQLKVSTTPGTKLVLQGEIPFRLDMLLLSGDNVRVLGGGVEQLATENSVVRMLSRILKLDDESSDSAPPAAARRDPTHQRHSPIPTDTVPPAYQPPLSDPHLSHASTDPSDGMDQFGEGTFLDEFDDFGINEEELLEADLMDQDFYSDPAESARRNEGERRGTEQMEKDWLDDPGHDPDDIKREPFEEAFEDHETSSVPIADTSVKTKQLPFQVAVTAITASEAGIPSVTASVKTEHPGVSDRVQVSSMRMASCLANYTPRSELSHKQEGFVSTTTASVPREQSESCGGVPASSAVLSVSHSSSKSKLSLKQPSSRTRVVEVAPSSTPHPPVASVRPFKRVESIKTETVISTWNEQPYPLQSLSQLSAEFWQSHPIIEIQGHFVQVCGRISHSSGKWVARVIIADQSGDRLTVNLSNQILEDLIGFTAIEFRDHINPNRNDPLVKSKASKGFAHCQSSIAQLNCFMVISKPTQTNLPCIVKLLDH